MRIYNKDWKKERDKKYNEFNKYLKGILDGNYTCNLNNGSTISAEEDVFTKVRCLVKAGKKIVGALDITYRDQSRKNIEEDTLEIHVKEKEFHALGEGIGKKYEDFNLGKAEVVPYKSRAIHKVTFE